MTTPRVTVPADLVNQAAGLLDCEGYGDVSRQLLKCLPAAPAPEGGAVSYAAWDVVRRVANLTVAGGDPLQDPAFAKYPAIADLVSKAQSALATREEAPAEAGEDVNWKAEYEAACAARISDRQKSQEVINERDKWVAELLQERAALRAQPQAREDAQPFMFAYENVDKPGEWRAFRHQVKRADGSICPGRPLYTHSAPDALRVAVEALETTRNRINTWPIDDHETCMCGSTIEAHDIGSGHFPVSQADHAVSTIVAEINKALAALQAEQKGGA